MKVRILALSDRGQKNPTQSPANSKTREYLNLNYQVVRKREYLHLPFCDQQAGLLENSSITSFLPAWRQVRFEELMNFQTNVTCVLRSHLMPKEKLIRPAGIYIFPARSRMNAYPKAISLRDSNLPEAPPCPASKLVCISNKLSSVFISLSLATHLAGSQY